MLLTTSEDLLFVVLAFCALWLTVFLSWFLYYLIAISRDVETLLRQGRKAVETVDHLTHAVYEKFEHSAASLTLIAQAVKELVIWVMQERNKKVRKKRE
ncbi:hypothetical protein HY633_00510 [Candidatus Uhrbacteria bacterium]|nr:hypothetical protein [Candidatus Uhrbacteria bacterium]